jgi:tRNA threonylcarbamoyladenosine biosynthesis protein TsaE
MLTRQFDIADAEAMEHLGARLAQASTEAGLVVHLHGDLGAGKTTLVRGFLRGLGHKGNVRSPTYTLVEPYDFPQRRVYHLDLYRLGDAEELEWIGLRDLLDGSSVVLIEWPERGQGVLPPADLEIQIEYRDSGRQVVLIGLSPAGERTVQQLDAVAN